MKSFRLFALGVLVILDYVASNTLLNTATNTQNTRVSARHKNCAWQDGECTLRSGQCGRGTKIRTLTGPKCPLKTRRAGCKVACAHGRKKHGKNGSVLSPSEAGLVGSPHKLSQKDGTFIDKLRECEYVKSEWGACDMARMRMSRTLTLTNGDPSVCKQKKIIMKACKKKRKSKLRKKCDYSKGTWNECDKKTFLQSRTVYLVKGNKDKCPMSKTIARRCVSISDKCKNRKFPKRCMKRMQKLASKVAQGCVYNKGKWGPCDPATNVKSRILTRITGDPKLCPQEKAKSKKCKKSKMCKYTRGPWRGCDPTTRIKTRIDKLKPNSPPQCNATRNVTKACRQRVANKKGCQYKVSSWGECDTEKNERNRTKILYRGDTKTCQKEKIITRTCIKPNGKERCFFGSYGKYKPCQNGVKTKTRPVISGPPSCQRKAAKTKPCHKKDRKRH